MVHASQRCDSQAYCDAKEAVRKGFHKRSNFIGLHAIPRTVSRT
jgi:hypothetical protein